MPLESVAITRFDNLTALHKVAGVDDPELKLRIEKLYDTSPEFASGADAVALFESAFHRGDVLYLGMFNAKPIVAMGCFDDGQTDSKRLQYIVVHPANRGRGIAPKFIKQVTDMERKKGVKSFVPGCGAIHRVLVMYDLLTVKG